MAIKKAEYYSVGEAYVKFDLEYTERNKLLIKEIYLKEVGLKAREFLKTPSQYKISIEYEEGSTKTKFVYWATALFLTIGNYGDFRSGLKEIISDVKSFSSFVIDRMDDSPKIPADKILNAQQRTGIPGRMEEVFKKVDRLERNLNGLSQIQIQNALVVIKQDVANLLALLPEADGHSFIAGLDIRYTQNLPDPEEKKAQYFYNRYALKPEEEHDFVD